MARKSLRNTPRLTITKFVKNPVVFILAALCGMGYLFYQQHFFQGELSPNSWRVCFTPSQSCRVSLVSRIEKAKHKILVQAYSFTAYPVAAALIAAHRRGVQVGVILDASNLKDEHSIIKQLSLAGVPIYIDQIKGIAHNKTMMIDDHTVITGSYNFTNGAEYRNAENLLIIQDQNLCRAYQQNWEDRRKQSRIYSIAKVRSY